MHNRPNDVYDNYCINHMAEAGQRGNLGGNLGLSRSSVGGQIGVPQLNHQRGRHLVMTEDPDDGYQGSAVYSSAKQLDQYKRNLESEISRVEKRAARKTNL